MVVADEERIQPGSLGGLRPGDHPANAVARVRVGVEAGDRDADPHAEGVGAVGGGAAGVVSTGFLLKMATPIKPPMVAKIP